MTASISATQLGWNRAALDLQRAAIELARETNRRTTLADGLRWYAITSARLGRADEARDALNEARATADGQSGAAWQRIRAEIDLAQAVSSGVSPAAARIAAATNALTYFEQSGATWRAPEILLARATVRQATGETEAAYADLKRGLQILAGLRESIAPGVDQMTFADVVRRLVSAFVELEESRGLMREAFEVVEDARGRDLSQTAPSVSLGQLEAAMPAGVVLLQFVVGEARSFAWVVQHSGSSWFRIDLGRPDLAQLVDAMGPPRFERAAAVRLRALLLGDTLRTLPKDGLLIVIPDGPLHLVSFATLPGARTRYLIEEHPILVAPSARSWLAASARLDGYHALPSRAFVAGNPRIDRERYGDLPTLPSAEEEARSVAALYRATPVPRSRRDARGRRQRGQRRGPALQWTRGREQHPAITVCPCRLGPGRSGTCRVRDFSVELEPDPADRPGGVPQRCGPDDENRGRDRPRANLPRGWRPQRCGESMGRGRPVIQGPVRALSPGVFADRQPRRLSSRGAGRDDSLR